MPITATHATAASLSRRARAGARASRAGAGVLLIAPMLFPIERIAWSALCRGRTMRTVRNRRRRRRHSNKSVVEKCTWMADGTPGFLVLVN